MTASVRGNAGSLVCLSLSDGFDHANATRGTRTADSAAQIRAAAEQQIRPTHCGVHALVVRLRARKLVQWMLGYIALACIAFDATESLGGIWNWPEALQRSITLAAILGALPVGVITWYHGEKGRQAVCGAEVALVSMLLVCSILVVWRVCFPS